MGQRIKFETVEFKYKKMKTKDNSIFKGLGFNGIAITFGVTTWSSFFNLENIWNVTKDENKFMELYSLVDAHETIHGLILDHFIGGMESTVLKMHQKVTEIIK